MNKPTTCLCMIVKDEARGIVQTLESAAPFVDAACIIDTGSTDGTTDLVRKTCERLKIPLRLHFGTFEDFSTSRNQCMEMARESSRSDFFLELSGDETLESDPKVFRGWLEWLTNPARKKKGVSGAYDAAVRWGDVTLWHPRLTARKCKWRYEGRTHEALIGDGETDKAFGLYIIHGGPAKSKEALQRDLELLTADAASDRFNPRFSFYLGQTHELLGDHAEAIRHYNERCRTKDLWVEERYEAQYRIGCLEDTDAKRIRALLLAHNVSPHRAEPFVAIAEIYHNAQAWQTSYLFAKLASGMPYPINDRLGVRAADYAWRAHDFLAVACWNLEKWEEGLLSAGKAFSGNPRDERLRKNLEFFEKKTGKEFAKCFTRSAQ